MLKERMKGFIIGVITLTLIISMSLSVYALSETKSLTAIYSDIKIYVNEKLVTAKDASGYVVEPFNYNGTVYLPVRAVSEALGQEVTWNPESKSVYIGQQPNAISESQKSLEGYWERDDPYGVGDGLIVNVKAISGGFVGIITELPSGMADYGYVMGDTKWYGVELQSEGVYKLNDLGKNGTGEVYWFEMVLEFDKDDSNTIILYDVSPTGEPGSYQTFHKVNK